MNKTIKFINAYIKSMRPYTFFITGIAGILGLLLIENNGEIWRNIIILILLFTSYGINQVINDFLGIKEDKYNAPLRPIVSGELNKRAAVLTTIFLFIIGTVATYFLNPYALIIYFLAYLMNIIYEWMKSIPFLGNIWFGLMIGLAPIYGALASSNLSLYDIINYPNLIYIFILVVTSSSALCYYTYFKDYEGDKKVGKNTLIVFFGPQKVRYLNLPTTILPFFLTWVFIQFGFLSFRFNYIFLFFISVAFLFSLYAGFFCFKKLDKAKKALELNFECTSLFLSSLLILINPIIGIFLFILSFIFIKIFYYLMYKKDFY